MQEKVISTLSTLHTVHYTEYTRECIRSRFAVIFSKNIRIILMHFMLGVNKCFKMGRNENRFMKNIVQI